jgi:hypothetical protein
LDVGDSLFGFSSCQIAKALPERDSLSVLNLLEHTPAPNAKLRAAIDAKNERAANWHTRYGAVSLQDAPATPVMVLFTFAADLKAAGQL